MLAVIAMESAKDEGGVVAGLTACVVTGVPTCVPPVGQAPQVVWVGSQMKNVTVPVGVPAPVGVPVTVAVSLTVTPGKTGPAFETWVAKVAEFCWLTYVQVTRPPPTIVMLATLPAVVTLAPPLEVQLRLSKVKPEGSAPSVTVELPAGTLVQSWVLLPAGRVPPSFSVKLAAVACVQEIWVLVPAIVDV